MNKVLYLIGSLRNKRVTDLAKRLRKECPDVEVFDDWFSAGREADDYWKSYEQERGRSYEEALRGYAARHVFAFDKHHLDRSTHTLLVLPAGKSGHMEVMYAEYGTKAQTAILLDPEDVRWDVMYQFIPTVLSNDDAVSGWLNEPVYKGEMEDGDIDFGVGRNPRSVWTPDQLDMFAAGGRCLEGGIPDGRRAPGLLSERACGSSPDFEASRRQASSR